jgi:signal transduction histidine kinase
VTPGDEGAIVEAFATGSTSGLTAVDRARAGATQAVRIAIAGGAGSAIAHAVRAVGFGLTMAPAEPDAVAAVIAGARPHAILLDAAAPAARDVLAQVVEERAHPPVVAIDLVGSHRPGDAWLAAGADDYLTGDQLTPAILRRAIESAIARGRARELRHRLDDVDRLAAIATLAGGVAHEVNNPAAYVLMNLRTCQDHVRSLRDDLVSDDAGDGTPSRLAAAIDEMAEMLDDNVRGVERIVAVVHALRTFARPEPDRIEQVDLPTVVRDVYELLGSQLRHKARVVLDLDVVPPIAADARKLSQVVINLLVNAADGIPPGVPDHEIAVRVRSRDGKVELAVTDTGPPLSSEQQARVFEPFFPARAAHQPGSLGLATVRAIVDKLGGRVGVTSTADATEFRISLPIRVGAGGRAPTVALASGVRRRILVIDDEVPITRAMRRHLRGHHDVTVTNDVTSALAALAIEPFDVILSDVMMPGQDGPTLLATLRRTRPDLASRVVFMSAGLSDPMRDVVRGQGARLIDKPIAFDALLALIDQIADG